MSNQEKMSCERRRILAATVAVGGVGAAAAVVPFVSSMLPSERAKAAGASVEADISNLQPGQKLTFEWRGKPVWILKRTQAMLDTLSQQDSQLADPASDKDSQQPAYCKNSHRSQKPEILVVVGICTHLGCSPSERFKAGTDEGMPADWKGGFFCPCHGSTFDLAGRVFKKMPAPDNLEVPPHRYLSDTRILIGEDPEA
ncbi:MAG: ubiquinol-cytochrome c reductase iron-sulfur subunit [Zoogloeaceae bacterium]|jgi:ubiquinol-cytochrome c reductase iron-sulfur subunit|nr:ubiquinol-cytochrome c reductase iron-sulfur subunit [Zoogloeaceae bacterium]